MSKELSGGSVQYYKLTIERPINLPDPYDCECDDIIAALGMTFAEGNQFKALWRTAAARTLGKYKEGMDEDGIYDADKGAYYARVTQLTRHQAKEKRLKTS